MGSHQIFFCHCVNIFTLLPDQFGAEKKPGEIIKARYSKWLESSKERKRRLWRERQQAAGEPGQRREKRLM